MSLFSLTTSGLPNYVQTLLDTKSLMQLSSTCHGIRKAYLPQFDKRLTELFGLMVASNATHDDVIKALSNLPEDETKQVINEINDALAMYPDLFCDTIGLTRVERPNFSPEYAAFETREHLLQVCARLWMDHAQKASQSMKYIFTTPSSGRFLHVVSRRLGAQFPEAFEPKLLGYIAAANVNLVLKSLPEKWKSMTLREQASALITIAASFKTFPNHSDPRIPILQTLLSAEGWADTRMQKACARLAAKAMSLDQENPQYMQLFSPFITLSAHLTELARSNCNTLTEYYLNKIGQMADSDDLSVTEPEQADALKESLLEEPITKEVMEYFLIDPYVKIEHISSLIRNLKEKWRSLSAREQAEFLIRIGENFYFRFYNDPHSPLFPLVRDFVDNAFIGWKDASMQKGAAYLMHQIHDQNAQCRLVVKMINAIAHPAYADEHETIFRLLSNLLKAIEANEGIDAVAEEWHAYTQAVSDRKIKELSLNVVPKQT